MSESLEQNTNEKVTINDSETATAENNGIETTENKDKETTEIKDEKAIENSDTEATEIKDTETNDTTNEVKKKTKKPLIIALSSALAVIIIVGVILLIVFNSKSEEAKRVDSLISSIGTVTLDSESKIIEAEKEVEGLPKEDYEQLDNIGQLEEARKTYDNLVLQEKADIIIEQIDSIGEVTVESKTKIEAARSAYDNAEESVQKLVTNYDKLTSAESKYSEALDASYAKEAESVIALINGIRTVTEDSEKKISEAEKAYEALSSEAKKKVTNYSTLTKARSDWKSIKKKSVKTQRDNILSNMEKIDDNVQNVSFYIPKERPDYWNIRSYVIPHLLIDKNERAYLCVDANYYGDNWIFFNNFLINADGKTYQRKCSSLDTTRETKKGKVVENYSKVSDDSLTDFVWINAVANSNNAIIRFQGGNKIYDLTISESDREAFKQVADAYSASIVYHSLLE